MTNPVDVLRDALPASYSADRRDFGDEFADMLGNKRRDALADVERLVEAAREYAYAQGLNTEPFGDDEEYREEILRNHGEEAAALVEALARFPKHKGTR